MRVTAARFRAGSLSTACSIDFLHVSATATPPRLGYLLVGRSCPICISFVSRSSSAESCS